MKIQVYSNWCEIDQLDGEDLRDGEMLLVTWPDGTQNAHKVYIQRSSYTISDMGHPYEVPVRRAYIKTVLHGIEVTIPLIGMDVERIKHA